MNHAFKIAAATLLLGSATLALAQAPKESFADTFARMQSLSSPAPAFHQPTPSGSISDDPAVPLTTAQMQAWSSETPMWQLDHGRINPANGPTFAQSHPHGLPFDFYQAAASNSDEYKLAPGPDTPAFATAGNINIAHEGKSAAGSAGLSPVASSSRGGSTASTQSN